MFILNLRMSLFVQSLGPWAKAPAAPGDTTTEVHPYVYIRFGGHFCCCDTSFLRYGYHYENPYNQHHACKIDAIKALFYSIDIRPFFVIAVSVAIYLAEA